MVPIIIFKILATPVIKSVFPFVYLNIAHLRQNSLSKTQEDAPSASATGAVTYVDHTGLRRRAVPQDTSANASEVEEELKMSSWDSMDKKICVGA